MHTAVLNLVHLDLPGTAVELQLYLNLDTRVPGVHTGAVYMYIRTYLNLGTGTRVR